ncbi:MAG: histidine kinase dimerization/phospho-acceptor domain-containing protein, partial [Pseudomonadota bacterium]
MKLNARVPQHDARPPEAQAEAPRFFSGITGRLIFVFASLSLLPLVAALFSAVSTQRVEQPLAEAIDLSREFAELTPPAKALSNMLFSEVLVDGEPAAGISRARADTLLQQLDALAPRLDEAVRRFGDNVPSDVRAAFERQSFVATAEAVRDHTLMAVTALEVRADVVGRIARKQVVVADVVASLEAVTLPADVDTAPTTIDPMLADIRAGIRELDTLVAGLTIANSVDRLDTAATDYAAALRDMILSVAHIPDPALRQTLGGQMQTLFEVGAANSGDNVFEHVRTAALAGDELREARLALQGLRESINDRLGVIEESNGRVVRELVVSANDALSDSQSAMVLAAIISILVVLAVAYRYVYGDLLRRFRTLTDSTQAICRGDLDTPIVREGSDELGRIAMALEIMRQNAQQSASGEQALMERTRDLEQANAELDKFAYVASHDLRAPLRAVRNLVGFLEEDLINTIPDESVRHLEMISQRLDRLDGLLSSLLDYSRIGRQRQPLERVDLAKCIEACMDVVPTSGFQVVVSGEQNTVFTYATPLQLILRNLIDNACKHHDQETGLVTVHIVQSADTLELEVQDDGP